MDGMTEPATRADGRSAQELRPVELERDFTKFAPGSVLVRMGRTAVLCTASFSEEAPRWLRGTGKGWVTAEYSMLPGSSPERVDREAARGRQSGRTQEIQRLIGRSLRAVTDLSVLVEQQVTLDCDVLQADGRHQDRKHRGAWVALHDACSRMVGAGLCVAPRERGLRGGVGRDSWGYSYVGPRICRGRWSGGGHERGHDQLWRPGRGAGDRGGRPFLAQGARRDAGFGTSGIAELLVRQAHVVAAPPPERDPRGSPIRG